MKYLISIILISLSINAYSQTLSDLSRGNKFNPAIGLNALTLYKNSARNDDHDGFSLQEAELQFSSDVDAYFRAEATFGIHQEEGEEGSHGHANYTIEPEEVFVETISIPKVTIKAGKFYVGFGKYNTTHTHALPFIYRSQLMQTFFGEEGLKETGIGVSFLAPLPWFSEVRAQAVQPTNETLFVDAHHSPAYVLRWRNLWDLSETLTFEFGASGLSFSTHDHGSTIEDKTTLLGADMTFKWRPIEKSKYTSFLWSTEFIHKDRAGTNTDKNGGLRSFVRYQLAQRWYLQGQYEFIGFGKNVGVGDVNAYAGLLAFVPTEFSAIRAQYDSIHDGMSEPEKRLSLQLNISIGAHPAHRY